MEYGLWYPALRVTSGPASSVPADILRALPKGRSDCSVVVFVLDQESCLNSMLYLFLLSHKTSKTSKTGQFMESKSTWISYSTRCGAGHGNEAGNGIWESRLACICADKTLLSIDFECSSCVGRRVRVPRSLISRRPASSLFLFRRDVLGIRAGRYLTWVRSARWVPAKTTILTFSILCLGPRARQPGNTSTRRVEV